MSKRTLREPQFVSSSTAMPFNPMASSYSGRAHKEESHAHEDMERRSPYGGGRSAHSRGESALSKVAPRQEDRHFMTGHGAVAASHGQAPAATSLQGSLGIIEHPSGGHVRPMGIPGIISSTSLGPMQRNRLVSGIIIPNDASGHDASGPVHAVEGHDATAYNEGMIHIRGSSFL